MALEYDVLIVTSSSIITWVRRVLLKLLEGWGLRCCLEQRDFLPGESMPYQWCEKIQQSRKVLLLLTSDFSAMSYQQFASDIAMDEQIKYNHPLDPKLIPMKLHYDAYVPVYLTMGRVILDCTTEEGKLYWQRRLRLSLVPANGMTVQVAINLRRGATQSDTNDANNLSTSEPAVYSMSTRVDNLEQSENNVNFPVEGTTNSPVETYDSTSSTQSVSSTSINQGTKSYAESPNETNSENESIESETERKYVHSEAPAVTLCSTEAVAGSVQHSASITTISFNSTDMKRQYSVNPNDIADEVYPPVGDPDPYVWLYVLLALCISWYLQRNVIQHPSVT